jgi:hypothetical protein
VVGGGWWVVGGGWWVVGGGWWVVGGGWWVVGGVGSGAALVYGMCGRATIPVFEWTRWPPDHGRGARFLAALSSVVPFKLPLREMCRASRLTSSIRY